jgi:preprotein translocase subunit SecE
MAKTALATNDEPNLPKSGNAIEWVKGQYENTRTFLGDVRIEMRKVVSPNRKEVEATTIVVLVTVFVFALFFWVVDSIFTYGLHALMSKLAGQ